MHTIKSTISIFIAVLLTLVWKLNTLTVWAID